MGSWTERSQVSQNHRLGFFKLLAYHYSELWQRLSLPLHHCLKKRRETINVGTTWKPPFSHEKPMPARDTQSSRRSASKGIYSVRLRKTCLRTFPQGDIAVICCLLTSISNIPTLWYKTMACEK